ncbi:MAG TPA: O-antigen ligase family protein [Gaiellaceae bacterium]|nr:O-antigen ligase family protein [Gaiellaceae bacterium]
MSGGEIVSGLALPGVRPRPRATLGERLRALTAEQVAIGATAVAVAGLPLLVPAGPANIAPADLLIGVAIVAATVWGWRTRQVWRFPYLVAIAVFVLGGALGAVAGPVPGTGAVALVQDIVLLLACWSVANVCSTPERLQIVLAAWAYSAFAWASVLVVGIVVGSPTLKGETARDGARTTLTLHDPNYAASYFFVGLMIVWAAGRPRGLRARLAATAALVVALVSTGSNSGVVSLIVGAAVAFLVFLYRQRGPASALAALVCLVAVGYVAGSNVSITGIQNWAQDSKYAFLRDGIGRGDSSITERSTILHESLPLYRSGGFFGQGPASTKARLAAEQAPYVKEAHDDYVATLLERGAIGVLGLILLVGSVLQRAWSGSARRLHARVAAVVPHPSALAGAVAGTLAGAAFNELLHTRHVWALFAVVAAVGLSRE